jgi:hypothetical protein
VLVCTRPPAVSSNRRIAVSGGEYAWTLTAGAAEVLTTSCTCAGPNGRAWPAGITRLAATDSPAGTVRSVSSPWATVNAPTAAPWSWKPVLCPGSQLSSQTSRSVVSSSRANQRRAGSNRTVGCHRAGWLATALTSRASSSGLTGGPGRTGPGTMRAFCILFIRSC